MKKLNLLLLFFLGMHSSWAQGLEFETPVDLYVSLNNNVRNYKFDDVTGDGINDFVIVRYDSLIILKGNVDHRTYKPFFARKEMSKYGFSIDGKALAVEDLNNDGYKDIMFTGADLNFVLLMNKQGVDFEPSQYFHTGANFAQEFAIADFNKDGYLDVALPHGHDFDIHYFLMSVYMNNKGSLNQQVLYWYPTVYEQPILNQALNHGYISAVDMNDDSYLDLVFTIPIKDSLLVSYNQGNTQGFQFANLVRTKFAQYVEHAYVFDIDLDGKDDVVGVSSPPYQIPGRRIYHPYYYSRILTRASGNNELQFDVVKTPEDLNNLSADQWLQDAVFVDFNGDGERDLFFKKSYNDYNPSFVIVDSFTIHYNKGKGIFDFIKADLAFKAPTPTNYWSRIFDVNQDGLTDITYVDFDSNKRDTIIKVLYQKKKIATVTSEQQALLDVQDEFGIYPNPSSGWVTLATSTPMQQVLVYNVQGMPVWVQELDNNKVELDTSAWAKGLYQVKVINDQGKVCTEKMIIE